MITFSFPSCEMGSRRHAFGAVQAVAQMLKPASGPGMPDDHAASGRIGQTLGGKYLVERLLGEGGMGAVYEAEHLVTKRRGALKLLHLDYAASSDIAERFLREASAAGRIGSAHIVETFDAGRLPSGEPYIFMELLIGCPLRELILQRGHLPFDESRLLVLQAAEGLAAAHAAGIVHRDVKPDNLFVCAGEPPFVKILDFGISKFSEQLKVARLTEQGATLGTPHYMSPEQVVSKRDIDGRVDVYALGVVLYECITGRVPFDAESLPALSVKIFEGRYTPASALAPQAPNGLDDVLARALAREPGRRFATMHELSAALLALPSGTGESRAESRVASGSEAPPPVLAEGTLRSEPDVSSSTSEASAGPLRVAAVSDAPLPTVDTEPRVATRSSFVKRALLAVLAVFVVAALAGAWRGRETMAPRETNEPTASTAPTIDMVGAARADRPELPAAGAARSVPTPVPPTIGLPATAKSSVPGLRATASATTSPSKSRAATDGLTERNPFAE